MRIIHIHNIFKGQNFVNQSLSCKMIMSYLQINLLHKWRCISFGSKQKRYLKWVEWFVKIVDLKSDCYLSVFNLFLHVCSLIIYNCFGVSHHHRKFLLCISALLLYPLSHWFSNFCGLVCVIVLCSCPFSLLLLLIYFMSFLRFCCCFFFFAVS